jgi:hypothetical protein
MTEAVGHLPDVVLSPDRAARTKDGLATRVDRERFEDGAAVRMHNESSDLIAIGFYDAEQKTVKPRIVLG